MNDNVDQNSGDAVGDDALNKIDRKELLQLEERIQTLFHLSRFVSRAILFVFNFVII